MGILARISHHLPTASADGPAAARPSPSGLLDGLFSTPASASGPRAARRRPLGALATGCGEKCGLPRRRGVTVVETLVALAVAGLLLTGLVRAMTSHVRLHHRLEAQTVATQTLRLVLEVLSRDLRRAGFDPRRTGLQPLALASSRALALQADDDGDGLIDLRSDEIVAYEFDPATGVLRRTVGRQAMPLADLAANGFALAFFDGAGAPLATTSPLDDVARARVERVRVTAAVEHEGRIYAQTVTDVALRNRP